MGGEPVTYAFVSKHLQNIIRFIGLNPALYKGHSFRIGAATHAAQLGYLKTAFKIWADGNRTQFADTFGCQALHLNSTLSKYAITIAFKCNVGILNVSHRSEVKSVFVYT